MKRFLLAGAVMILSSSMAFAAGENAVENAAALTSPPNMEELAEFIKIQQEQIARQEKQLQEQKARIDALSDQLSGLQEAKKYGALAPAAGGAGNTPQSVGVERKPKDSGQPPRVDAVENEGGILLAPGKGVLEPSLEYSRSSAVRVAVEGFTIIPALNIGSFEITQVDRDSVVSAVSGRVGVMKDMEVSARVPYLYRNDNTLSRPFGTGSSDEELNNVTGEGLGDVEVATRYQITHGQGGWPFLIGNLRFKTHTGTDPFEVPLDPATGLQTELPTGSGFYALQPSVTAILPSDPVVLYANLGYLYNMTRDFGGTIGEIDPGDSINASFGMGFAVNDQTSFSLGYSHDYVFETERNGLTIANSDKLHVGILNTGFAYRLNDRVSFNLNIGAGVTDDAPDVSVLFRVPIAFDLF